MFKLYVHDSWLGTFVSKIWRWQIKRESRILQSLSSNNLKHTVAHILLCNLAPRLFGKFCVQSFGSKWSLHSPFIHNFRTFLANHIYTFCTTFTPFLIMIDLKKNTFNLNKPSWEIASWRLFFLTYFWIFCSQNIL